MQPLNSPYAHTLVNLLCHGWRWGSSVRVARSNLCQSTVPCVSQYTDCIGIGIDSVRRVRTAAQRPEEAEGGPDVDMRWAYLASVLDSRWVEEEVRRNRNHLAIGVGDCCTHMAQLAEGACRNLVDRRHIVVVEDSRHHSQVAEDSHPGCTDCIVVAAENMTGEGPRSLRGPARRNPVGLDNRTSSRLQVIEYRY